MNSRPLTYLTEENTEITALTPAMFSDIRENGVPDLNQVYKSHFAKRIRYRQRLKEEFRKRFRIQYLGQLSRRTKPSNSSASVAVGDVVLIENNLQKRLDWPLAVIREVYPGKDGYVRVVKLKTSKGELVRPIQKLIPLEVEHSSPEADNFIESTTTTSETTKGKAANTLEESVAVPKEEPKSLEETSLKTRRGRIIKKSDRFKY